MTTFDVLSVLFLLAVIGFQSWLTVRVWKSPLYERGQKLLQSKVIWLLPVIGAVIVYSLMPEEDRAARSKTHFHL